MEKNIKSMIQFYVRQLDSFEDEKLTDADLESLDEIKMILGTTPKLALLDELVKYYKSYYNNISRNDLPLALAEAGLSNAVTDDGVEVYTKTEYTTKTLDKDAVASWLAAAASTVSFPVRSTSPFTSVTLAVISSTEAACSSDALATSPT